VRNTAPRSHAKVFDMILAQRAVLALAPDVPPPTWRMSDGTMCDEQATGCEAAQKRGIECPATL
jgi:hypothetical protein